jgi:hypothetical protein
LDKTQQGNYEKFASNLIISNNPNRGHADRRERERERRKRQEHPVEVFEKFLKMEISNKNHKPPFLDTHLPDGRHI